MNDLHQKNETSKEDPAKAPPSVLKRWTFRCLAMLLGLSPFLLFELVLVAIGWQPTNAIRDPYVGFSSVRPLFVLSDNGQRMTIAENRQPLFCDDSFAATKPTNGFRIFCVGGSTVQGRPFAIDTAFSTWLELTLNTADADHQYEVINCGGVSYASYRLAPIIDELVNYQPDVIILYTGHNEFLEDRTYESIKSQSQLIHDTHGWLSQFRTYSFLRSLTLDDSTAARDPSKPFEMPTEVEARLDYAGGLELYHRDKAWQSGVTEHFEINLQRIVQSCRAHSVPLLLVKPVSNLKDAKPFKSQHRADLSEAQLREFDRLVRLTERDRPPTNDELRQDVIYLNQAVEIDGEFALTQFRLGQTYLQLGEFENAKRHFLIAREEDICPLRILSPLEAVIDRTTKRLNVPSIDAKQMFESKTTDGIVGAESLVDHVHPSIASHQVLAEALTNKLLELKWLPMERNVFTDNVVAKRNRRFQDHLDDIPYLYFELGKDRLKGLERWATGAVRKQRVQE
ncbi:MAG: SGNH/GDSL hydrolase family protein [Planctomycetota bacterium]